jgi:4-hydroxybutyryl-CoA dehydratase/vinylacetyl-CoA-Delta-isomerase
MLAVAKTYELAHRLEHRDIMTATSHIKGEKINRLVHILQSTDDLDKKSKMSRLLGRKNRLLLSTLPRPPSSKIKSSK